MPFPSSEMLLCNALGASQRECLKYWHITVLRPGKVTYLGESQHWKRGSEHCHALHSLFFACPSPCCCCCHRCSALLPLCEASAATYLCAPDAPRCHINLSKKPWTLTYKTDGGIILAIKGFSAMQLWQKNSQSRDGHQALH